jgi:hypothetical protein
VIFRLKNVAKLNLRLPVTTPSWTFPKKEGLVVRTSGAKNKMFGAMEYHFLKVEISKMVLKLKKLNRDDGS